MFVLQYLSGNSLLYVKSVDCRVECLQACQFLQEGQCKHEFKNTIKNGPQGAHTLLLHF